MDLINIETNSIKLSGHTPDYSAPWVDIRTIDFSGIGIPDVSTAEGKAALRRVARDSYVIENLVARWKTEEELYDLEAARSKKLRQIDLRLLEIIESRAITRLGANGSRIAMRLIAVGDRVAAFAAILGLLNAVGLDIVVNDVISQYLSLVDQIEVAENRTELEAIIIP